MKFSKVRTLMTVFIAAAIIFACVTYIMSGGQYSNKNEEVGPEQSMNSNTVKQETTSNLTTVSGEITVSNVIELEAAVNEANKSGNTTILLDKGTYCISEVVSISTGIVVRKENIMFRSKSGNRDDVVIKGDGMDGEVTHIFNVFASGFTAQDMTIGWVKQHAIQIQGEDDADRPVMRNLHIVDARSQMIKISYVESSSSRSDDGLVEKCLIEYSSGIGVQYYTGGIDGHFCRNWIVRNNTIKGIKSPESELAEHAIHFWSFSEGTCVENNRIIDCDRGIGFGLGDRGHIGGIISGNYVNTTRDVGIGLENSSNTEVYNNTVYTENYANSIEYRFPGTNHVTIRDNVTNGLIVSRDGGIAKLEDNEKVLQS